MGLLLAPYNNAMRLGQGFNSYSQEICIDDAVIIDPLRAENTITNDGMTMKQFALMMTREDAWTVAGAPHKAIEESVDPPNPATITTPATSDPPTTGQAQITDGKSGEDVTPSASAAENAPATEDGAAAEGTDEEKTTPSEDGDGVVVDTPKEEGKTEEGPVEPEDVEKKDGAAPTEPEKSAETLKASTATKPSSKEVAKKVPTAAEKKRAAEEERAEQHRQAGMERAKKASSVTAYTKADMDAFFEAGEPDTKKEGDKQKWSFSSTGRRGPSQIVTYTSKFVDKLSDITEDMSISGAFSIRYNMIGGSAKGAFIDANKFKESDLNFYISVKVVNQTVNFKDALVFNDVPCRNKDNFPKIFGDSFISGFIEGGEFNALVSMKVLNKESKTALAAEAKVALTASVAEITGEAKVRMAKKNITRSTEMTIQVTWSGGGHIKPMDQQWDIDSLTAAASRFPDLVALTPQRTYAILTKYDSLRSWIIKRPENASPLQYEVAQVYTNSLMDTFMDYKSIYTQLSSDMSDIQSGVKKFLTAKDLEKKPKAGDASAAKNKAADTKTSETATTDEGEDPSKPTVDTQEYLDADPTIKAPVTGSEITGTGNTGGKALGAVKINPRDVVVPAFIKCEKLFPATLKGLSWARRVVRFQMIMIVNEVDALTADPAIATLADREEVFQNSYFFRDRLPKIGLVEKEPDVPLGGVAIGAEEVDAKSKKPLAELYVPYNKNDKPDKPEQAAIDEVIKDNKDIAANLRLTALSGANDYGEVFSNLDFLKPTFILISINFWIDFGAVIAFTANYSNGLALTRGTPNKDAKLVSLDKLGYRERIIGCSIEEGRPVTEPKPDTEAEAKSGATKLRITSVKLYTNRGRSLIAQASDWASINRKKEGKRGGFDYKDLATKDFDPPLEGGYLKGFWGRSMSNIGETSEAGVFRLGCIWGNVHQSS